MRYFLGFHKFAPTLDVMGDRGWEPSEVRWNMCIIRLLNRILGMNANRISRQVFEWDITSNGVWARDIHDILVRTGLEDSLFRKEKIEIGVVKDIFFQQTQEKWASDICYKTKLRTYHEIKHVYGLENYVMYNLSKKKYSLCAQLRAGILGLHIETGRYVDTAVEDRLCSLCDLHEVENKMHFVFYCPFYDSIRQNLFKKIDKKFEFLWLEDFEKLKRFFKYETYAFATFLERAWSLRRKAMYS